MQMDAGFDYQYERGWSLGCTDFKILWVLVDWRTFEEGDRVVKDPSQHPAGRWADGDGVHPEASGG